MPRYNVYKNNKFKPAQPTGQGAVVIARSPIEAAYKLEEALAAQGFDQVISPKDMQEISMKKPSVAMLITGDY